MRPAIPLGILLLLFAALPSFASAEEVLIAPADDRPLAAVLLSARGATDSVLLFDPRRTEPIQRFLKTFRGRVRCFQRAATPAVVSQQMSTLAGGTCERIDRLPVFARQLRSAARSGIAVAASDYPALLRAAAFAASTQIALLPLDRNDTSQAVTEAVSGLDTIYRFRLPAGAKDRTGAAAGRVVDLDTAEALEREWLPLLAPSPPDALVIANPRDVDGLFSPSGLSLLAPLLSAAHRAPLLLVDGADPAAIEREALTFLDAARLHPTHIILVGDELALRSHTLPDPVITAGGPEARGGGKTLRVELFSEIQQQRPQDLSVGRIVAEDATSASVLLARQRHHASEAKPVVLLGNADEAFSLGEAISRVTVEELRNVSVPVRAFYRDEITPAVVLDALDSTELLVWEGHARDLTLEERGGIAVGGAPEIAILQGCYTLDRSDPFILLEKGTFAIVASSAAIYSAPGSAFAHAIFDSFLYERADLGTAVRNARNFLFGLSQLQRSRNHPDWRKTYRAALAFALWGDPTLRPRLDSDRAKVAPVAWTPGHAGIDLDIPAETLPEVSSGNYRAQVPPRAQLGGLVLPSRSGVERRLKDLYFTVQRLPRNAGAACAPNRGWSLWSAYAPRSGTLTVLARPDWVTLKNPARRGRFRFALVPEGAACPN